MLFRSLSSASPSLYLHLSASSLPPLLSSPLLSSPLPPLLMEGQVRTMSEDDDVLHGAASVTARLLDADICVAVAKPVL